MKVVSYVIALLSLAVFAAALAGEDPDVETPTTTPKTPIWVTITTNGQVATVKSLYKQSFMPTYTEAVTTAVKSGEIGMGSASGTVGGIRTYSHKTVSGAANGLRCVYSGLLGINEMSEELTNKTEELTLDDTILSNKTDFTAKHPLNNTWTLWYTKPQVNRNENWHDLLKPVITFSSVEEFWGIYNSIPAANQLPLKSDYHLFKEGIKPEWEDEQNAKGGRWQYAFSNRREVSPVINELWLRGLLSVIGGTIEDDEDEVNGIVLNVRKQAIRIGIWTRDCDEAKLKKVGERLRKVLRLAEDQKIDFMSHDDSNRKGSEPQILL
ncbi:Eukaryotic translation initiation factor 4E [[Candida] zeylanoides]